MITSIGLYAGAIFGACVVAVTAILVKGIPDDPPPAQGTALVKREHAPTQPNPVFLGMPAQRQPSALEQAIDLYIEHGIDVLTLYVHSMDDAGNGWD